MQTETLTFANSHRDFITTLNKRVNDYFKTGNISRHGNREMYIKTVCMFLIYFIPYTLIVTNVISGTLLWIAAAIIMGVGLAGIGLSVMHDANHGAYAARPWVNNLLGYSLNLIGGNALNWKVQHNVLHHTFTNVHDHDEDISPRGLLRFCPGTPWKPAHRAQFIYAFFLYGFMTIVWLLFKDFVRIFHYQNKGLIEKQKTKLGRELVILLSSKAICIAYIFVVPLLVTPLLWWQIILGIFITHFVAGFILGIIFQCAHVVEGTEFPIPDEHNNLANTWAVHQLLTTANFANSNRMLSWYVGGLNFQVEHHLFPNVCHVHYRNLAPIVKQTAQEYGLPYKAFDTFFGALGAHARLLKKLGRKPGHALAFNNVTNTVAV